jgi:hypothetical protein
MLSEVRPQIRPLPPLSAPVFNGSEPASRDSERSEIVCISSNDSTPTTVLRVPIKRTCSRPPDPCDVSPSWKRAKIDSAADMGNVFLQPLNDNARHRDRMGAEGDRNPFDLSDRDNPLSGSPITTSQPYNIRNVDLSSVCLQN